MFLLKYVTRKSLKNKQDNLIYDPFEIEEDYLENSESRL